MNHSLPSFDQIYVISELHLGGTENHQIFTSADEARLFLAALAAERKKTTCLVINGDLVDFLAEDNAKTFDPANAEAKLNNIAERPQFADVFKGLRKFVSTPNHHLALTLGNHDLELALPWVRWRLLDILSGGNDAAKGRISLVFDGSGFCAQVGGTRVLCLHGNEVDEWNVTNYETLRKLGRDARQGRLIEPWKPNAGSRMVVEVMNAVKREWAFVDLLKPEQSAVPLILLALDPELVTKLADIGLYRALATANQVKMKAGFLGEPVLQQRPSPVSLMADAQKRLLRKLGEPAQGAAEWAMLDEVEHHFSAGTLPVDLLEHDQNAEYLGKMSDLWAQTAGWLRRTGQALTQWAKDRGRTMLRKALECLVEERLFDLDVKDPTYAAIDALAGQEFQLVVTGHTHLERVLPRENGSGYYYNSGTWAGLMKLEQATLDNDTAFGKFYAALKSGSLAALESANLVVRRNSVVTIQRQPTGGVQCELRHISVAGGKLKMEIVPNSQRSLP